MLGTCNKCKRTGRAENLTLYKEEMRCPNCLNLHFMFSYWEGPKRMMQVMDFAEGRLRHIAFDEIENEDERVRKYIAHNWEKINSKPYEYNG